MMPPPTMATGVRGSTPQVPAAPDAGSLCRRAAWGARTPPLRWLPMSVPVVDDPAARGLEGEGDLAQPGLDHHAANALLGGRLHREQQAAAAAGARDLAAFRAGRARFEIEVVQGAVADQRGHPLLERP